MITIDEVRQLMASGNMGLLEAKKILKRRRLLEDLEKATSLEDLKDVIRRMI
ncbi:hypothetical protein [Rhizobium arsenicireducens]